ncbi:hypothetical protein DFJ74DRAFT_767759 [Hyaloraphidium curvatum]|nr:hypothetical protein DFJ74DRAFT_767759 [Hyaloraphidium curvatum]
MRIARKLNCPYRSAARPATRNLRRPPRHHHRPLRRLASAALRKVRHRRGPRGSPNARDLSVGRDASLQPVAEYRIPMPPEARAFSAMLAAAKASIAYYCGLPNLAGRGHPLMPLPARLARRRGKQPRLRQNDRGRARNQRHGTGPVRSQGRHRRARRGAGGAARVHAGVRDLQGARERGGLVGRRGILAVIVSWITMHAIEPSERVFGRHRQIGIFISGETGDAGPAASTARERSAEERFRAACRRGHLPRVEALLALPDIDANAADPRGGFSGLLYAAFEGHSSVVARLLADPRVEPDARSQDGKTALIWAAYTGHAAVVQVLLADGRADPNARAASEMTALGYACQKGHAGVVELLLKDGRTDCEARGIDRSGDRLTPFHFACLSGGPETCKTMLEAGRGVDFDALSTVERRTGFFFACTAGQAETARLLLKYLDRLDAGIPDRSGRTAFEVATEAVQRVIRSEMGIAEEAPDEAPPDAVGEAVGEGEPASELDATPTTQDAPTLPDRPAFAPDILSHRSAVDATEIEVGPRVLGEGGFGTVREGTLRGRGRVAVKLVRGDFTSPRVARDFEREVRAWDGVTHPNVLPLLCFCASPPMLVTELADNGHMLAYLSARAFRPSACLRLLAGAAAGMRHLHSLGIVHGDLKPRNVLVLRGRAAICDFGLSRVRTAASGPLSATRTVRGTEGYLAPEVLAGTRPRKPADAFAFAMTAYEVLSHGRRPFAEVAYNRWIAVPRKVAAGERPGRPAGVADAVWALVERCWAQEPRDRPAFGEVVEVLERERAGGVPRRQASLAAGSLGRTGESLGARSLAEHPRSGISDSDLGLSELADSLARTDVGDPASDRSEEHSRTWPPPPVSKDLRTPFSPRTPPAPHNPPPPTLLPGTACRVRAPFSAGLAGQVSIVNTDSVVVIAPAEGAWVLVRRTTRTGKVEEGLVPAGRLVPRM